MIHEKSKGKLHVEKAASLDTPELIRQQTEPSPSFENEDETI